MSHELPHGWAEVLLPDIANREKFSIVDGPFGSDLKLADYVADGVVPVLTTKNLTETYDPSTVRFISTEKFDQLKRSKVVGGDILIAKIGSVGKCSIYPYDAPTAIIPANLCKISVNKKVANNRFVYWQIRTERFQNKLKDITSATAQPAFSVQRLKSLSLRVAPLGEQRRIVAKLDKLLDGVDACQQRLAKIPVLLKRFRQSVLAAACSGCLTADWREENPGNFLAFPAQSCKRALPPIAEEERLFTAPQAWQWIRLGTVAAFINGDRGKNYPNKNEYVPKGIPFINTGHIEPDGSLSAETMHFLTREKFDSLRSGKIQKGDLVYCLRGATLGKTALVEPYEEGAIASSLVIIRLNEIVDQKFGYFFLTSPYGKVLVDRFDNGSAQPNLSADSVKHYVFSLPPLAEQQEIVRRVESLFALADQLESRLAAAQRHVDALTPSLLARAFSGQLVPQDPNDEPASSLLARIGAKI